jgi:hypothetical protein
MTKRRSSAFLLLLLFLSAAIPVMAQANRYSTDCEAARQALQTNNPNQLAPCSASTTTAPTVPALTTKQMIQTQVAGTLVNAFVNMLFSDDSQARAQKQKMMAELKQRQAEAERQHKIEEAQRLAAICSRLQATLKLSGVPDLQIKRDWDAGSGDGLRLKLGDDSNESFQVVNYLKQPLSPPTPPSGGGLQLKTGEDSTSLPTPDASIPTSADAVTDARNMTPQQLADLATQFNNLPPGEQQRLMDAARNSAPLTASATSDLPSNGATNQSALTQLQQIAVSSQAAASAQTPEAAAAAARIGFDQAAGGAVVSAPGNGSSLAAPLGSSNPQPSAAIATGTHGLSVAKPAVPTMVNTAVLAPPPPLLSASSDPIVPAAPAAPKSAPALTRIQQMTDQQLQNETCRAHAMLLRITADSQKNSQELEDLAKEVRQTRREAVEAGLGCFSERAEKALSDKLDDKLDGEEKRTHNAAFEKDASGLLKKAQDLQTDIGKAGVEYQESDRAREDKLENALNYLNAFYEYVREGDAPWVASLQCAIDFGYLATKVHMEQQQISLLTNNLDSAAGSLKAESSVAAFHKKLVDESLRRGLDPISACH